MVRFYPDGALFLLILLFLRFFFPFKFNNLKTKRQINSEWKMYVSVRMFVWLYQGSAPVNDQLCGAWKGDLFRCVPFILWFTSSIIRNVCVCFLCVLRSRFRYVCMFNVLFVFVDAFAKRKMCWIASLTESTVLHFCADCLPVLNFWWYKSCVCDRIIFYCTPTHTPSDPFTARVQLVSMLLLFFYILIQFSSIFRQPICLLENSIQLCCFAVFQRAEQNTIFIIYTVYITGCTHFFRTQQNFPKVSHEHRSYL